MICSSTRCEGFSHSGVSSQAWLLHCKSSYCPFIRLESGEGGFVEDIGWRSARGLRSGHEHTADPQRRKYRRDRDAKRAEQHEDPGDAAYRGSKGVARQ